MHRFLASKQSIVFAADSTLWIFGNSGSFESSVYFQKSGVISVMGIPKFRNTRPKNAIEIVCQFLTSDLISKSVADVLRLPRFPSANGGRKNVRFGTRISGTAIALATAPSPNRNVRRLINLFVRNRHLVGLA